MDCSDIGPAGPDAVLFHDPNRAVRDRLLRDPLFLRRVTAETRLRASRRILAQPRTCTEITEVLRQDFTGLAHQGSYEMLPEEFADTLLVIVERYRVPAGVRRTRRATGGDPHRDRGGRSGTA